MEMSEFNEEVVWIREGCQRLAVARAIYKPMTGKTIAERARSWAPKIQVRDVWFVLQQFREKGLAYCLTPQLVTGNLYFLTDRGRATVAADTGEVVPDLPESMDWIRYALVVRARLRRLVLQEIARPCWREKEGKTASEIRRRLVERRNPVDLNGALRALAALRKLRLARSIVDVDDRRSELYILTPMGRRIVAEMQR